MAAVDIDNHHLVPLESITWRWRSHCSLLAQKITSPILVRRQHGVRNPALTSTVPSG